MKKQPFDPFTPRKTPDGRSPDGKKRDRRRIDPTNWRLVRHAEIGTALVVEILYPDATNFEGKKIIVFAATTISALREQRTIDPHFSESEQMPCPVARFKPTKEGWRMAMRTGLLIGGTDASKSMAEMLDNVVAEAKVVETPEGEK